MRVPELKDTDVVRLPISINGSFSDNIELTGRELRRLAALVGDGSNAEGQAPKAEAAPAPAAKPEVAKPQGTAAGDADAEDRNKVQGPKAGDDAAK